MLKRYLLSEFRKSGLFLLKVEVAGAFETSFAYQTEVPVETEIRAHMQCPDYVIRNVDFHCTVTMETGDNVTVSMPPATGKNRCCLF